MGSILTKTGEQAPVTDKGHGTKALGPSDSSDSGSDVQGGPGLDKELRRGGGLGLDRGSTSDYEVEIPTDTGGADIGDANLDSDSDASGSGERAAAGRDALRENSDIMPDHIEDTGAIAQIEDEDISDSAIEPADEELLELPAETPDQKNKKERTKRKRR